MSRCPTVKLCIKTTARYSRVTEVYYGRTSWNTHIELTRCTRWSLNVEHTRGTHTLNSHVAHVESKRGTHTLVMEQGGAVPALPLQIGNFFENFVLVPSTFQSQLCQGLCKMIILELSSVSLCSCLDVHP